MSTCCKSISGNFSDRLNAHTAVEEKSAPPSRGRGSLAYSRWSLPAVVLVLLPKCPACLAAYVAVGTGLSLNVESSYYLRELLIVLCVALIVLNVLWLVRKVQLRFHFNSPPRDSSRMRESTHA